MSRETDQQRDSDRPHISRPEDVLNDLQKRDSLPFGYTYPASLDFLEPGFRSLLISLRLSLTEALRRENANVSDGVPHPPFHLDFMDAPEANALAFQHENYAFIIITVPMMMLLEQGSARLSGSSSIAHLLGASPVSSQLPDRLFPSFFSIQLSFLIGHEYTHHNHEHVKPSRSGLMVMKEIQDSPAIGGLKRQAREACADTYAVYIALTNLFDGDGRETALNIYALRDTPLTNVDEALLTLFTLAVGGFFYSFPSTVIDSATVYQQPHPPEDVRMNYVMHGATSWCNQNRPALETWMNPSRYQTYMRAVVEAIRGAIGQPNWNAQLAFLLSRPGKEYRVPPPWRPASWLMFSLA